MTDNNMTWLMTEIIGTPHNDLEEFVIFLAAACVSVLTVFAIIYIIKLIGGIVK